MSKDYCFLCYRADVAPSDWDLDSLKMINRELKVCQKHKTWCETRIIELSKKTYTLKAKDPENHTPKIGASSGKQFVPPIIKKPTNDWYEREPGEEG